MTTSKKPVNAAGRSKEEILAAEQALKIAGGVNVFDALENGQEIPDIVRKHKPVAKLGNLFHEYIKDTSFQTKGAKSDMLAQSLEAKGLMIVDWEARMYSWIGRPLTKQEVLDMYNRNVKLATLKAAVSE